MRTIRVLGLLSCILLFSGLASAGTVTIKDVLDYTDNERGFYFLPPNVVMDHPPYFRMSLEDWDWTHVVKGMVPADANGIQSASLSIYAWDVDGQEGEIDIIYANGVRLGTLLGMPVGEERTWTTTVFNLPAKVVQELWQNGEITIFMDIDKDVVGDRVAIGSSTLTVNYSTPGGGGGGGTDPDVTVYRFWSPVLSGHFYTISEQERDMLISQYPDVWTYEGGAYLAFSTAANTSLRPIYRFWSGHSHFYTISEQEKDMLIRDFPSVWTYEGVAFYAYPEGLQPDNGKPVYRFWSASLGKHFYTISEDEKQTIIDQYSYVWQLEGVAWYAHTGEIKTHDWPSTF
jgi:hypothetical protein